jgi:hypothetical protein
MKRYITVSEAFLQASTYATMGPLRLSGRKSYRNRMANFLNLIFLITLPKNDRQDLKMGCIDASLRQLQSVLKIRF